MTTGAAGQQRRSYFGPILFVGFCLAGALWWLLPIWVLAVVVLGAVLASIVDWRGRGGALP